MFAKRDKFLVCYIILDRVSGELRGRIGIEKSAVYGLVNLLLMVPCNGTVCTVAKVSLHSVAP
jgi:hypothetical protein